MSLTIKKNLVPAEKYPIKCPYTMKPTRIVVHNTANNASAANEVAYMIRNDLEVSFHYAVDHIQIVQGVLETRNSWNAGDGSTGKGNREGISIEICYSKNDSDIEKFKKAEKNAVLLIVDILKRYKWDISKVTKHQDYSGKYCPHRTLDMGWKRFLKMIETELTPPVVTPQPVVYPFKENTIVYPKQDVKLVKTAGYADQTIFVLKKDTKSKVIKYHNTNGLHMALADESGNFYSSAWTKEFDKFTTTAPVVVVPEEPTMDYKKEYEILKDKIENPEMGYIKQLNDRDSSLKKKEETIKNLNAQLERYERFSVLIGLLERIFPVKTE